MNNSKRLTMGGLAATVASILATSALVFAGMSIAAEGHSTSKFQGIKANTGTASHSKEGNRDFLAVSDDFKIPDTPAPHWQVVDSKGNVYLLNQLRIKDGKTNRKIPVPSYVHDVAKVQIWCSFAEALLGEASFPQPVALNATGNDSMMKQANAMRDAR
jgi:hypothetical protein